jgi:hypothetical protein
MSVQFPFHIFDKFIKFSPDITSMLPFLKMALDIIHGDIFRIYEGSSKNNGPFSSVYIFNTKLQQLKIIKNNDCNGWGL